MCLNTCVFWEGNYSTENTTVVAKDSAGGLTLNIYASSFLSNIPLTNKQYSLYTTYFSYFQVFECSLH